MTRAEAEEVAEKQSGYSPKFSKALTENYLTCSWHCSACYWRRVRVQRLMEEDSRIQVGLHDKQPHLNGPTSCRV